LFEYLQKRIAENTKLTVVEYALMPERIDNLSEGNALVPPSTSTQE
jgi:hypothetical protein